ncbi:hypothetical protein BHM03_00012048 [Ensete ventricosum]|nr:hypothetical protein BHM03_00012048 [Ensete ventricosum]
MSSSTTTFLCLTIVCSFVPPPYADSFPLPSSYAVNRRLPLPYASPQPCEPFPNQRTQPLSCVAAFLDAILHYLLTGYFSISSLSAY